MSPSSFQRPDCFGYLSKLQRHIRRASPSTGWSRRYCVLKDAALYFYDDANSERAFGVACLHGFRVHASAPNSGGRKHAFELEPPDPTQRTYTFATESEIDKKRFVCMTILTKFVTSIFHRCWRFLFNAFERLGFLINLVMKLTFRAIG